MGEVVEERSVRVGFGCGCGFDVDAHELLGVHSAGRAKPAGRPMCGKNICAARWFFFKFKLKKTWCARSFEKLMRARENFWWTGPDVHEWIYK